MIAKQAGYEVSGSDEKNSRYIEYIKSHGIPDIHIGQTAQLISQAHKNKPIDWFVYSSAVSQDSPELHYCRQNQIKCSKRDDLLNEILSQNNLRLIAVAGTHGKTTTTAMIVWLCKQLQVPVSYSVGAKIPFGEMGEFNPKSEFFIYECDEFDRNFLQFYPHLSVVTGIAWDHHEIYPTKEEYNQAFRQFLDQSSHKILWSKDQTQLNLPEGDNLVLLHEDDPHINEINLLGWHNRANAWQATQVLQQTTDHELGEILRQASIFPGVSRRFEKITKNLYSDYAHTPEKILGAMGVAKDAVADTGQKIVVVYEPLTNRRMHHTRNQHQDVFEDASAIFWVPSYLAREDPAQEVLPPAELIKSLNPHLQTVAKPMELNDELKSAIDNHLKNGDLVLCLSGGGGGSLDEWLRNEFKP